MAKFFYQTGLSHKIVRIALITMVLVYLFSLYHRYIQQDEPWFGEEAYWLVKEGNVKLKSMPGIFNWTSEIIIYHKLLIWIGALLIMVFGWNVYIFKTAILAMTLTCSYLIFRYVKKEAGKETAWLSVLLLCILPELIHRSFIFRPEVIVMLLGFCSYYFLNVQVFKSKYTNPLLAGFFAGLAFLTHLNAVVFPVVGFISLLFFKRWKDLFWFSASAFIVCSIYTVGLWGPGKIETFQYQLQHWPTHQDTFGEKVDGGILNSLLNNLKRLLNEHKRYFWDQDVWGVSGLFLIALISRFKYLMRHYKPLLIYTLLLMFFLGLLSSSHGSRYLVYLMPFMIIITSLVVTSLNFQVKRERTLSYFFLVLIMAQLIFAGVAYSKIFIQSKNYNRIHQELVVNLENGARVLGPWEMIYNEIDSYQFHSYKTYEYIEDQEKRKLSQLELLELAANRFNMDYIILDDKRKKDNEFDWFNGWEIAENPYFEKFESHENYLILKRK